MRSGSRPINYLIYTYLSLKESITISGKPFSIKDCIESVSEVRGDRNDVIFSHSDMPNDPFIFLGTNLPSFYGGTG